MKPLAANAPALAIAAALTLPVGVATTPSMSQTDNAIAITGTLTDEGVQCAALHGDDGVIYTFRRTVVTRQFRSGERIRLEGRVQRLSICQQGTTIAVTRAEKVE